jgi:hypothetical protein
MFKVWLNLAPFGGRQIRGAFEALLNKVVNQQSSVLPTVVFFITATVSIITQPNSAESIILSEGSAESMMLSVLALRVSILSACAESIIPSAPPAESMIISAPPTGATRKHTSTVHKQCIMP